MVPMFAEIKVNGKWQKVGQEFPSTFEEMAGSKTDRVYDGDSALLNKVLTNKDGRLKTYCGYPDDVSKEIKEHTSLIGKDVYYVYLYELIGFLYQYVDEKMGYITEWQYKRLKDKGVQPVVIRHNIPSSFGIIVSKEEMDMILENPELRKEDVKYYVKHVYIREGFDHSCPFFFKEIAPILFRLNSGTELRIVYGLK